MSVRLVGSQPNPNDGATYDLDVEGTSISIEFSRGRGDGDLAWQALIVIDALNRNWGGDGFTRRGAFLAARSRRGGAPLPALPWDEVLSVLQEAGAF